MYRTHAQLRVVALALVFGIATWSTLCARAAPASGAHAENSTSGPNTRRFGIWSNQFLKDGRPFQIISGSIHYHRCVAETLQDVVEPSWVITSAGKPGSCMHARDCQTYQTST